MQNVQQPTTSRPASRSATPSKGRNNLHSVQRKPFKKFRDDKLKEIKLPISKHNLRRKTPLGLTSVTPQSRSQVVSRKIVNQIRKRQYNINNRSSSRTSNVMAGESVEEVIAKTETGLNFDDDCIVIETKPEIIIIEDETKAPPVNEVKELENKYLKFKHYEAIGSIRLKNSENNYTPITSTPKIGNLNDLSIGKLYGDTSSITNNLRSSRSSSTEDCTFVQNSEQKPNDVIIIDDTIITPTYNVRERRKRRLATTDDSVVFVSENVTSSFKSKFAPEFIPLDTPLEESHFRVDPIVTSTPKPRRTRNDLFNTREANQLKQYNDNAYNPNKDVPEPQTKKRLVIVDGSNVAYCHALNKEFSVKGLKICLDYFEKMGHEVKAVVPQFRLQKLKSTDPNELENLHRAGKIVFTPCKNLPGKSSTSYDDRFILQLAAELDAAIVSNDNYRDLINENSAFKKIIENRVIGYTWCNDIFILPKDPYGKWGPTLAVILNRS